MPNSQSTDIRPVNSACAVSSNRQFLLSPGRLPLILATAVLILDQATKLIVLRWLAVGESYPVIDDCFHLVHYRNKGAAWGMFQGQTLLLALFSVVILAAIMWKFSSLAEGRWERALALGIVVGGTMGNLIDRLFRGEVVDFLLFFFRSYHWPAFNVADSAICCGITVYIASSVLRKPLRSVPESGSAHESRE